MGGRLAMEWVAGMEWNEWPPWTGIYMRVFREFTFSLFSKRILELMQLVEEVAFQKLDRRLASLLLRRGRSIKVSHQELADELGTVREMITRLLKSFSDTGLITLGRERIKMREISVLKDMLES